MSNINKFAKSKFNAFKAVVSSDLAQKKGAKYALKEARYKLSHGEGITHAAKGRAVHSFGDYPNNATTTIIHSKNLVK